MDVFPAIAYSGAAVFSASPRTVIAHRASKIFLLSKTLPARADSVLCLFCIQVYKFLASSSFEAACTVDRIREVVLERGQQERPKFAFEPVNAGKRPAFQQVQEKTLGQILGVIRGMPPAPSEM